MSSLDEQRITIREYIDLLLKGHAREHELVNTQLKLQATEYERRLTDLNHAHAEAQRVLNTYIPRASYEIETRELRLRLDKLERSESNLSGKLAAWSVVLTVVLAALTVAANMVIK